MTVIISATTEIKGALKVGDLVKVEGFPGSGNTVQAQEDVKIVSPTVDDSLNLAPAGTGTEDKSGSSAVQVDAGTAIENSPKVGDTVEVEAILKREHSLNYSSRLAQARASST
jgi:hypothetical protein